MKEINRILNKIIDLSTKHRLLTRKLMHIAVGLIIIFSYIYLPKKIILTINFTFFAFFLMFSEYLKKHRVWILSWLVENFSKSGEAPLMGLVYFLVGSSLSIYFFEKNIALASIAILTFGDSFSSLFGFNGHIKIEKISNKNIEGIVIGIIASSIAAKFFVSSKQAVIGSVFSMIAEYIDLKTKFEMDDNILVPIVAGISMSIFKF